MLKNRCPVKYKCQKVVGSVRTQGEKKHVMAFKITAVSCKAEWDAHLLQVTRTFLSVWADQDHLKWMLQVVYSKLKLRQLNQAANGGAMDTQTTGLTNSMMGGGLGVKHWQVVKAICTSMRLKFSLLLICCFFRWVQVRLLPVARALATRTMTWCWNYSEHSVKNIAFVCTIIWAGVPADQE